MRGKKLVVNVLTVVVLAVSLTSCATTTHGLLSTSNNKAEEVFKGCIQAAGEANFGITTSDPSNGFIVAEQDILMGQGEVVRMNIAVKEVSNGTEVNVVVVPPPGTIGNVKSIVNNFSNALKRRIPDVKVVSIQ